MTLPPLPTGVVPAQLGFLAIFNPSLGNTDETLDDQIVYYASVNTQTTRRRLKSHGRPTENISQEERNERLRQIGLAQGMVEFGKGFSGGESVDTIDTEKARVVLHELEPGWWVLASINLTQLPKPINAQNPLPKDDTDPQLEFSAREVKPAELLLQDLLRAHSVFLLHHAPSLSALFIKTQRPKFVSLLSRYWDMHLSTWNVMLHGNPINNAFGGIKIAACGELGVGVGEEERGSGEREVLEGFVGRIEGLVDIIVSKFGVTDPEALEKAERQKAKPDESDEDEGVKSWLGTGEEPGAEDGAVFLGVGALSRKSKRDITYWMEEIFTWGDAAYGVKDSPSSNRQSRRFKRTEQSSKTSTARQKGTPSTTKNAAESPARTTDSPQAEIEQGDESGSKVMNYLKLGYGTYWTLGQSGDKETRESGSATTGLEDPESRPRHVPPPLTRSNTKGNDEIGHYLIGLVGDVEETASGEPGSPERGTDGTEYNSRTVLRTLNVELESEAVDRKEQDVRVDLGSADNDMTRRKLGSRTWSDPRFDFDSQDRNKAIKARVVLYVNKPFIYTFLFQNRTESLAWDGLYKSLHHQLAPLRRPLVNSTAYRPGKPDAGVAASHIFDLVWDPRAKTLHSTIPNIPDPLQNRSEIDRVWSRVDALNTHMQILNQFANTRRLSSELERTCKTSRGWWIVWTRILDKEPIAATKNRDLDSRKASDETNSADVKSAIASSENPGTSKGESSEESVTSTIKERSFISKEIFLIRKASDHGGGSGFRAISNSYVEGGGSGWADGASRLAQGIGVDTRKYIEGLLSLTR